MALRGNGSIETFTTTNTGALAARRHTMTGDSGKVRITNLDPAQPIYYLATDSAAEDLTAVADADGMIRPGASEVRTVGLEYVVLWAERDAVVRIEEVADDGASIVEERGAVVVSAQGFTASVVAGGIAPIAVPSWAKRLRVTGVTAGDCWVRFGAAAMLATDVITDTQSTAANDRFLPNGAFDVVLEVTGVRFGARTIAGGVATLRGIWE
jgi:hypothetical protein